MTASQISVLLSKALNRELLCIESKGSFLIFLSEKDKTNYLKSPNDFRPFAWLDTNDNRLGLVWTAYNDAKLRQTVVNDQDVFFGVLALADKIFTDYFLIQAGNENRPNG